ncbi:MAG: DEAD/DEAH box helicase [Bryobacteraceae bacterium]|nr:DEAD/DEAH box helicase [Bryobacteraceae bacterium]
MDDDLRDTESIEALRAECRRLQAENDTLRRYLAAYGIAPPSPPSPSPPATAQSVERTKLSTREKVTLFRSLFRGREDVYAVHWQSPDGRSGYAPKTERDWNAYYAAKPEERKRVDKETRKLLPLTDEVIHGHLSGDLTVGIYPLLQDETCWFLAVDLDKKTWYDDALAFLATCRELDVPAALERSRSGNGGHIWIFFEQAVPAITARKLGSLILTMTMERRHQVGLDSYDRFFPNQDTMPKGGFGNLIALPLQRKPREAGNSVFLDGSGLPYGDQWRFLLSIRRVSQAFADRLVTDAQKHGDLIGVRMSTIDDEDQPDPWTLPPSRKKPEAKIEGPFPTTVNVIRSNLVFVEKKGLPSAMLNRLLRVAAFQNPEFYKAQAMRLSTFDKPRIIACGEDLPRHLALPRGCLDELLSVLESHGIKPVTRDERFLGVSIDAEFHGRLREPQETAVTQTLRYDEGLLCAPTAFGKTATAAWLIARRKVNTLVLVHRQQLLDQWRERLAMFLDRPIDEIGQVGAGKTKRTGTIDVAVIQSLYRNKEVKDFVADYGHVIIDECHHLSAFTFEQVMRAVKAKYVLGLTATPTRKDGHHPIIYMQCGPTRFNLSARAITDSTPFEHLVIPRVTDFHMTGDSGDTSIQDIYAALVTDRARNELIANDLVRAVEDGRFPLVLTGRTEHLNVLAERVAARIKNLLMLKGGMGRKQRKAASEALKSVAGDQPKAILATGSYIGEGFDDARLDTLLLAMPVSWKGTLQQYVGRLHRLHDGKRVVQVYDYVDANVRMLARMYKRRLKGYSDMGYEIVRDLPEQARLL